MFERFTKRVKVILDMARREALKYGHNKVEPEHILLAMLEEGGGVGIAVLNYLGVETDRLKYELGKVIKRGIPFYSGELPLSTTSKRVLEYSIREAQAFGHSYIGSEHLLLGILLESESIPAQILRRFGVTVDKARNILEEILKDLESGVTPFLTEEKEEHYEKEPFHKTSTTYKKQKTPTLDIFGRDLTKLAVEGKLDPVIGREREIERVIQILCRRKKNNPVLLGEPGVGKTAIVEGLAQQIAFGKVPEILKDRRIVMIDLPSMVAGTKYRGEFEQRVKVVLDEIRNSGNVIIFIDEIHTLVGAGGAEGAIDASNILKPVLSRGEIQCIGATTLDEYRRYIEKDGALERRFQPIMVNPPTVEETIEILKGLREKYESHHKIKISDEAIEAAAKLSDRFISDRFLPDKAIDLIDEAASQKRLKLYKEPQEIIKLQKEVELLEKEKEKALKEQDQELLISIRDKERELKNKIDYLKENLMNLIPNEKKILTKENIAEVVSQWTGIPVSQLCKEEKEKLLEMENYLHKIVVGQDEAIEKISKSVRRSRAGLKDIRKPIGSFLFLGPTGVGKTLLARALAEFLFGDEDALIQIDMSEYMEKFSISRLIGAPPGYIGYEEGGQLTEKVRRRPYSVILFDEIEKAHPDVFNLLLQILEDGRLTDSFGRAVSFKNTVIIMTSNIGTEILKNKSVIGFLTPEEKTSFENSKNEIIEKVKKTFRPEFLNRLDDIIIFHPLTQEHLLKIVEIEVGKVRERLKELKVNLIVTDEAKKFLVEKGTNPEFGARPLKRAISRYVEDPLSEEILKGNFIEGDDIIVDKKENFLVFKKKEGDSIENKEKPVSISHS
ncbi:MAG: ATP-dependent Clp protease ATP-binding subunit [Candidatus Omnitrophica bacterium]|nr:ATP-dependent Clp protease ATP-binding subunit [Candidatus Omnitrophota bacterium]MCM8802745.1 ATP-dependent Clp protease ATP-binding subunit [Candidatus Omnitrophota bacterium]